MPFFKFRRGDAASPPPAGSATPTQSVEVLRKRAKQRLIGASVLVLLGVVGFPLLFDTQPRPVAGDIPIEIPGKNTVKPLVMPTSPAPAASTNTVPANGAEKVAAAASLSPQEEIFSSKPVTAPAESAPPAIKKESKPESKPEPKPVVKPEPKPKLEPEPKAEVKPPAKPVATAEVKAEVKAEVSPPPKNAVANDDGARARALLNGAAAQKPQAPKAAETVTKPAAEEETKAAAAETKGRMVVQVGAFADAAKANEARRKLEGAGLKTYTQTVDTKDGKRIRVRVGPFATKAEAERSVNKIRSLDLPVAILSF